MKEKGIGPWLGDRFGLDPGSDPGVTRTGLGEYKRGVRPGLGHFPSPTLSLLLS